MVLLSQIPIYLISSYFTDLGLIKLLQFIINIVIIAIYLTIIARDWKSLKANKSTHTNPEKTKDKQ